MTIERVARAMPWSIAARIVAFVAGFAVNVIVVRSLGAVDWGILSELRTILGFVLVIVMLGLDIALIKFIPLLRVSGGLQNFFGTFRRLVALQLLVWIILAMIARITGDRIGGIFGQHGARIAMYLQVAVFLVIFEAFLQILSSTLQSFYETRRIAIGIACGNVLYIILIAMVLKAGFGIVGVLLSAAASNLCAAAIIAPKATNLVRDSERGPAPSAFEILRFSLPFVVTGLLNQIVWRQSEVLFLGHFRGAEEAGFFSLAYRNPQLVLEFVPLTIYPLIMAGSSEVYARDERNLARAVDLYYRLLYMLAIPVAALGFAFARPLVPMLFGPQMIPAASLTQLFFVVFAYSFLYTPLSMALYVIGKSWINMVIFLLLAIVNVSLDILLIPRYGLWGAMIPVPLVLTFSIIMFRLALRWQRPDVKIPAGFIARCWLAAIPVFSMALISAKWSSPQAVAAMIPVAIFLLYTGFRLMKVIGEDEKELVRKIQFPFRERILSLF